MTVRLSLDTTNIQHEKLVLQLLRPYIEGFSFESAESATSTKSKRKKNKEGKGDSKKPKK